MGTPQPCPPIEYGQDCPSCTPHRWPVGENPKFVYAMFTDVINCGVSDFPAPNGEVFQLEQNIGNICNWQHIGDIWHVFWDAKQAGVPLSRLRLFDKDGFQFFSDLSLACPFEYWMYRNDVAACGGMFAGASGFGRIWWNDKNMQIVQGLNLDCGPGTFNETFTGPGMKYTSKFNSRYQRTNIRFQLNFP